MPNIIQYLRAEQTNQFHDIIVMVQYTIFVNVSFTTLFLQHICQNEIINLFKINNITRDNIYITIIYYAY
jgi:hypothetical protein